MNLTVVKVLRKTLITMWRTLCQNYSRKELYQYSPCCGYLASHQFELDERRWLLASFRVRDRTYLSIGFIFRISEFLMVFRCFFLNYYWHFILDVHYCVTISFIYIHVCTYYRSYMERFHIKLLTRKIVKLITCIHYLKYIY